MGRHLRDNRIDTREARKRLTVRSEPYWTKITQGCALGYRKLASGRGTWIGRYRDRAGQRFHKSLGAADDVVDADGVTSLNYAEAQGKARDWFKALSSGGLIAETGGRLTVAAAMDRYLAYIEAHKKSHHHISVYNNAYIVSRFGKMQVADLTTALIRKWHEDISKEPPRLRKKRGQAQRYRVEDPDPREAKRKRQLRANRHLTTLKAALNLAWRDGLVAHRDPWERVQPFSGVERQRTRFLMPGEARLLLQACPGKLRDLVQAALLTGARYGELCNFNVSDFLPHASALFVRDSKSSKTRHVYLNKTGMDFFARLCRGRTAHEPLLTMDNGGRWRRDMYFRPFKAAVKAAGLDVKFTFHELRHTWASLTIMQGAPLIAVAQNLGHRDTRMVELHYGHLTNSYVRQVIQRSAPTFGLEEPELGDFLSLPNLASA